MGNNRGGGDHGTAAETATGGWLPTPRRSGHVLLICDDRVMRVVLELSIGATASVTAVRTAAETEGLGVNLVVIASSVPIAQLVEVRVHPTLWDKPVVLFAPGGRVPDQDWASLDVSPITTAAHPITALHRCLRTHMRRTDAGAAAP